MEKWKCYACYLRNVQCAVCNLNKNAFIYYYYYYYYNLYPAMVLSLSKKKKKSYVRKQYKTVCNRISAIFISCLRSIYRRWLHWSFIVAWFVVSNFIKAKAQTKIHELWTHTTILSYLIEIQVRYLIENYATIIPII